MGPYNELKLPSAGVREIFIRIKDIREKEELAETLAGELERLNILDLQRISAFLELDVNKLPSPYKEKIRPYFTEQFFGSYFKLMRMHGDGKLMSLQDEIKDKKLFEDFCRMVIERDEKPQNKAKCRKFKLVCLKTSKFYIALWHMYPTRIAGQHIQ